MAINKSNTSPFVKAVIIFFSIILVLGVGGTAILPLLESLSAPATTSPGQAAATVETTSTLAAKYAPRIAAVDAELKKDPKNFDLLTAQADAFQQWASEVQQATSVYAGPDDAPLWGMAVSFYERAAKVKPLDENISTNMAIAQFYTGDPSTAMATAQKVIKDFPTFAPVHFNLAVFYGTTGDTAKAIAEYERYLALDPKGEWAAQAQTRIADLKKQPATPAASSPGSLPPTSTP